MKKINIILTVVSLLPLCGALGLMIYNQPKQPPIWLDSKPKAALVAKPPREIVLDEIVFESSTIRKNKTVQQMTEKKRETVWTCFRQRDSLNGGTIKECEYVPQNEESITRD
jgi:hypothetical protein